ncbi:aromatic amino acid transaminase [Granulosicoccus antarcticus]|uniref:Aromatic-amino-acid aminotransferase n=1 Tax=Granulosicoccus antarcticus IMCC3135 TaxID=1192854 RepID=A0A2Z2NNC9_9GAMM|nr:aromatic amino acid transaminase [Granulosicoccus antarcticus]ASJ72035.1 Aromatic-amino-acid aminotransferase [Granulosicoccus antarcticus IMCC3135]
MISLLPPIEQDPLWKLTARFQADPRPEKLDFVLGVYKDEHAQTPVMNVVHEAELTLARQRASKAYRSLSGHIVFNEAITRLLLGTNATRLDDTATLQTIGGTGALRLLGEMIARADSTAVLWSTDPGYVNHKPIFARSGLVVRPYRWHPHAGTAGSVDMSCVLADLEAAKAGDVVLLHGCCHNPTGLDLDLKGWQSIAELCARKQLIPLVDMAYQGFADGLEEDAAGLRLLTSNLDTVLVAASCSKNMGLYCERTGAALVVTPDPADKALVIATLQDIARANYSMPADHGAAIAALVMENHDAWNTELSAMRHRLINLRSQLADCLDALGAPSTLRKIRHHKGMFSMLFFTPQQMERLRCEFAIYGTDSSRINIAGLSSNVIEYTARSLIAAA